MDTFCTCKARGVPAGLVATTTDVHKTGWLVWSGADWAGPSGLGRPTRPFLCPGAANAVIDFQMSARQASETRKRQETYTHFIYIYIHSCWWAQTEIFQLIFIFCRASSVSICHHNQSSSSASWSLVQRVLQFSFKF